jgi:hypothetical protein
MTVLGRVEVSRITERANQARPGLVLATAVGFVFVALGWLIAKTLGYTWMAIVWPASAIMEGFAQGYEGTPMQKARAIRAQARAG